MKHFNRSAGPSLPAMVQHSSHQGQPTAKDGPDSSSKSRGSRRRLNPIFVSNLMGMPWWLTRTEPLSFAHSEMLLFRSRAASHLRNLFGESIGDEG